jgi:hypothetical protein
VIGRLECSFYGSSLKNLDLYEYIIKEIYPRGFKNNNDINNEDELIGLDCFTSVQIKDYYDILFKGEKKHGRFLFLEEDDNGHITFTFSRFLN